MKKNKAFTLLEVLIALSISSFIVLGMMQGFRNIQKILSRTQIILQLNKSVCLLFNQMERDFNTIIIPQLAEEEKPDKKTDKKEESTEEKVTVKKDKKKEIEFFIGKFDEDEEIEKIGDKKYKPFKSTNFVNTNPLQIWGQKRIRLVRILYELIKDKKQSTREITTYNLYRKETIDLKNVKFEQEETVSTKKQEYTIRKHLVATNIKKMYLEYVMPKPQDSKDKTDISQLTEEEKQIKSFSWGKTKETKNIVPEYVEIHITFWGNDLKTEETFSCMIPILSYPTELDSTKTTTNNSQTNNAQTQQDNNKPRPKIRR